MSDNIVNLAGNLVRDPELRFTQNGKPVCNVSIAVNPRKFRDGQWVDGEPMFMDLVIWQQMGENAAASCHKGDRVFIRGQMEARPWEDKEGNKRISYEVTCDEFAVSLKWANVTIEKTNRRYPTNMSQPQGHPGPEEEPF